MNDSGCTVQKPYKFANICINSGNLKLFRVKNDIFTPFSAFFPVGRYRADVIETPGRDAAMVGPTG